eukprot:CAMPEP_0113955104 /NCGR_PEP_ID=MMETSP0011_2-20120614/1067_1 /TAXON_ID=101924 /ORGANISM="Rhodosorus marinus" /LENGTH=626 /DNA_ID=CAMNT_0000964595 /DNA_START=85 /DNA_END=1962 /DNA_ORIENTATION=- /assembly_acc=CAM_ASM_000156
MDRSSTPVFAKRPSRRVGLVKLKIFLTDSVDNEDVSQLIQRGGGDVQEVITDDTDVILVDENVILDPTVLGIENMEKVLSSRWIESCLSEGKLLPAAEFVPSWMREYELHAQEFLEGQVVVRQRLNGELEELEQNTKGPDDAGANAVDAQPIGDRSNQSPLVLKPGAETLLSATVSGKTDSESRQTRSQASARTRIVDAKGPNRNLEGRSSLSRSLVDMAVHTIGAAGIFKKIRPNKLDAESDPADINEQILAGHKESVHPPAEMDPRNDSNKAGRNASRAEHEASQSGTLTISEIASTVPRRKRGEGPGPSRVSRMPGKGEGNNHLDTKTEVTQKDVPEKGSTGEHREPALATETAVAHGNPGLVDEQVHVPKTRSQTKEGAGKNSSKDMHRNHTSQGEKTKGRIETLGADEDADGGNQGGQVVPKKMMRIQSEQPFGVENLAGGKESQVSRISARRLSASEDKARTARVDPIGARSPGNPRGRYSLRQVSAREENSRTQATSEIESTDDEAEEDDSYDAALETEDDGELESSEEPHRGGQAASKRHRSNEEFEETRSEYLVRYRKKSRSEETPTQKAVRYLERLYGAETDLNRRKARYYAFRALYESCKDGARLSVKRASKLIW